jgi:transcriptional regulator with XRE-family HTH domain
MSQTSTRSSGSELEFGQRLASRRASLGISREQIATTLLLSRRQVEGLERGDPAAFYNQTFYLQALRKYAAHVPPASSGSIRHSEDGHVGLAPRRLFAVGAALVLIAAAAGTTFLALPRELPRILDVERAVVVPPPPTAPPNPLISTAPVVSVGEQTPATDAVLTDLAAGGTATGPFGYLTVDTSTWVFVRYPDNSTVERTLGSGESLELDQRPVYLAVGAPQVELTIGGRSVDVTPFITSGREVRLGARELMGLANR